VKGVDKLLSTAEEVKKMQEELTEKQPILQEMKVENTALAERIERDVEIMAPKKEQVEKEEAFVN